MALPASSSSKPASVRVVLECSSLSLSVPIAVPATLLNGRGKSESSGCTRTSHVTVCARVPLTSLSIEQVEPERLRRRPFRRLRRPGLCCEWALKLEWVDRLPTLPDSDAVSSPLETEKPSSL